VIREIPPKQPPVVGRKVITITGKLIMSALNNFTNRSLSYLFQLTINNLIIKILSLTF